MSDEDRDVDIESDEDDDELSSNANTQFMTQAEKRAHHNALERKRRDHIKDSFSSLRDSIPSLQGEKVSSVKVSRAQILKKAADYIQFIRRKNQGHQSDIDDLKKQNSTLEQQIRALEKARNTGQFAQSSSVGFDGSESESSVEGDLAGVRRKKLKTA
ncbi:protein max-like isoform X1 [Mytilus californianus]|uniref:Protein max n=3 Tax=Mytilus TaxID=6548 RepID=A0A8B6D2S4_MYTGA|nr:protein max-like isoform X1 [Mytilus californianus]CAC5418908.1 MAX [Mytilus coruscus]CAG2215231.1 MAX [Mytilus edulis]VDI13206.1 Max protein [Mytilus galloprovincialis]